LNCVATVVYQPLLKLPPFSEQWRRQNGQKPSWYRVSPRWMMPLAFESSP
jgi:hypothetical protein